MFFRKKQRTWRLRSSHYWKTVTFFLDQRLRSKRVVAALKSVFLDTFSILLRLKEVVFILDLTLRFSFEKSSETDFLAYENPREELVTENIFENALLLIIQSDKSVVSIVKKTRKHWRVAREHILSFCRPCFS